MSLGQVITFSVLLKWRKQSVPFAEKSFKAQLELLIPVHITTATLVCGIGPENNGPVLFAEERYQEFYYRTESKGQ